MDLNNKITITVYSSISNYQMLQNNEFEIADPESHFDTSNPANFYFILSKNRITINPDYTFFNDNCMEVEILVNEKGKFIKQKIRYAHDYTDLKEVKIVSEYPFYYFKLVDECGDKLMECKATYLPEQEETWETIPDKDPFDYEILYIGQSRSTETQVPVLKRILNHSTYQQIQSTYLDTHTDKELFLLICSVKTDVMFDVPENTDGREEIIRNFKQIYFSNSDESRKQKISLIEAALINYFKPKYNEHYVRDFPSISHKAYSAYYNLNITDLNILMNLDGHSPRLYTDTIARSNEFNINYQFSNAKSV